MSNLIIIHNYTQYYTQYDVYILQMYHVPHFGTCAPKPHKNKKQNPWCVHGLGQKKWGDDDMTVTTTNTDDWNFRSIFLDTYSGLRNLGL